MDVLVAGAGVVGLAVAQAISRHGHSVLLAEATGGIGNGISSRNSEVIHGGMYYPSGSLRAVHCVAGRRLLYRYCADYGIPHARCGKLIVATDDDELEKIRTIFDQGLKNGVEGLSFLDRTQVKKLEPQLASVGAILSEQTGIVDSHALMLSLQGRLEEDGGAIAFNTPVQHIRRADGRWQVAFGGAEPVVLAFDAVVNAAGLGAVRLAAVTDDYPASRVPRIYLAKGNYFSCPGKPAFSHLIYPAPVDGGLGTHVTLDLAGRMRFGPDVEWLDDEDYTVDPARSRPFEAAIRRYWPALPDNVLVPDYAGIRPKLTGPGQPARDFVIDGPEQHRLPGLVQLFGIESPGLTASLSLASHVAEIISA